MVFTKLKLFCTITGIYLIFSEKNCISWKSCKITAHLITAPKYIFCPQNVFLFVSKCFLVLLKYKIYKKNLYVLYQNNSNQLKYYLFKNMFHSHNRKYSTLSREKELILINGKKLSDNFCGSFQYYYNIPTT